MNTSEGPRTTKKYVTTLLQKYAELQQKIKLLEYELKCSTVSGDQLIEAMALRPATLNGVAVSGGSTPDSTARIATEYENILFGMNEEAKTAVENELQALRNTVDRLNFYVQLLPQEQGDVIRGYYMEGKNWPTLEQELGKSTRTLSDHRDKGIDALAKMFQYIGSRGLKTKRREVVK